MNRRAFQQERLFYFLRGHASAIEFVSILGTISQVWDDLIDQLDTVTPTKINQAFQLALVFLPANEFYANHMTRLYPLVRMAVNAYLDANQLECAPTETNMAIAFSLRDALGEIVLACADIVGGYDWMREISLRVRLELINDESFDDYRKEHIV